VVGLIKVKTGFQKDLDLLAYQETATFSFLDCGVAGRCRSYSYSIVLRLWLSQNDDAPCGSAKLNITDVYESFDC
jgi:hypothetical protein